MKNLFLKGLGKGLASNCAIILALMSIFLAAQVPRQFEADIFLQLTLFPVTIALGFAAGERAFNSSFKEQEYFSISALPGSRENAWLSIVTGRIVALLVSIGMAAAGVALHLSRRPPATPFESPPIGEYDHAYMVFFDSYFGGYTGVLLLLLTSFFAGNVASLSLRSTIRVYGLGVIAIEVALYLLHTLVLCFVTNPQQVHFRTFSPPSLPWMFNTYWIAALCPALIVCIVASACLFGHFDLASTRQRLKNLSRVVVPATYSVLLAFSLIPALTEGLSEWEPFAYHVFPGFIQLPPGWTLRSYDQYTNLELASPDGHYLAIPECTTYGRGYRE